MPESASKSRSSPKKKAPSEKLPPHNIEAEEAVIASLTIDSSEFMPEVVQVLKPEHFFRDSNRWCYMAILSLWDREIPIDEVAIVNELRHMHKLVDVGGAGYLAGLISKLPSSIHCVHWAELIQNLAILRNMVDIGAQITQEAYAGNASEIKEVVQRCTDIFNRIHEAMGEMPYRISDFTKTDSDPPRYSMKINDIPLECSLEDLMDNKRFVRVVVSRCDFVPPREKEPVWNSRVNQLMRTMKHEAAPKEASIENSIWEAAIEVLKAQPFVETLPEFQAGLPIQKDDFMFVQGTSFLNLWLQRVKQTRNMTVDISVLWSILKRLGQGKKQTVRIGKEVKEAWRLPLSILNGSEPDYDNIELW